MSDQLELAGTAPQLERIQFKCPGHSRTKGNLKAIPNRTGRGPVTFMVPANPKDKAWEKYVRLASQYAMRDNLILSGAVQMRCVFVFERPANHYGTGRNADKLKPGAPPFPATVGVGDTDKLTRAIGDACEGVVYGNDAAICSIISSKLYCLDRDEKPQCWVAFESMFHVEQSDLRDQFFESILPA